MPQFMPSGNSHIRLSGEGDPVSMRYPEGARMMIETHDLDLAAANPTSLAEAIIEGMAENRARRMMERKVDSGQFNLDQIMPRQHPQTQKELRYPSTALKSHEYPRMTY